MEVSFHFECFQIARRRWHSYTLMVAREISTWRSVMLVGHVALFSTRDFCNQRGDEKFVLAIWTALILTSYLHEENNFPVCVSEMRSINQGFHSFKS